ncbi:MAG TPA: ABC transporter ATP-binding protein [Acidimicrobiia bacterium]|nr:ABC transporter ATP-binding protein [Acidimicrobiia bacterium]
MSVLVQLEEVGVTIDLTPIIDRVSLEVSEGDCLAILGPNGVGKTTLLRLIATLITPSSGRGRVLGAALGSRAVLAVRDRIGLAGHFPALAGPLTLAENLRLVARLTGRGDGSVGAALDLVGLAGAADRTADQCSHGMRRRADLARLFLHPPQLLLLDEPHAGLDASAAPIVAELVRRVRNAAGAAVLVSHDLTGVGHLAARRLWLDAGRLEPSE